MIPQRELSALRAEWILDQGVIEKDYVLGWLLAGIANHDALSRTWIFKGGRAFASATTRPSGSQRTLTSPSSTADPKSPKSSCRSSGRSPNGYERSPASSWSSTTTPSSARRTNEGTPPPRDGSPTGDRTATRRCRR